MAKTNWLLGLGLLGAGAAALYFLSKKMTPPIHVVDENSNNTVNNNNIYDQPTPPITDPWEYQKYLADLLAQIKKDVPDLLKDYIVAGPFIWSENIGGGSGGVQKYYI